MGSDLTFYISLSIVGSYDKEGEEIEKSSLKLNYNKKTTEEIAKVAEPDVFDPGYNGQEDDNFER